MPPSDQCFYCQLCSRPGLPAAGYCPDCALAVERAFTAQFRSEQECCQGAPLDVPPASQCCFCEQPSLPGKLLCRSCDGASTPDDGADALVHDDPFRLVLEEAECEEGQP